MIMALLDDLWTSLLYSMALMAGLFLYTFYDPDVTSKVTKAPTRTRQKRSGSDYQLRNIMTKLGLTYDSTTHFQAFCEHFKTFDEVSIACRKAGLDKCNLVIGVDFTASNEWQGRKTFNQNCLHKLNGDKILNPYQKVIWIIGKTLAPFDEDNLIPCFGFGDSVTTDESIFPFKEDFSPCDGISDVLNCYNDIVSKVTLSGPTSFAPVIKSAIDIVKHEQKFHILVIVADGQVTEEDATIDAIVEASNHPLSIIVVGVGDGPWDIMQEFDHQLPKRKFDNFRFIDYHKVTNKAKYPDSNFALQALMEIPHQYKTMKYLGYIPEKECVSADTGDFSEPNTAIRPESRKGSCHETVL